MGVFGAILGAKKDGNEKNHEEEIALLKNEIEKHKESLDVMLSSAKDAYRNGYDKARTEYVELARQLEAENQQLRHYETEIATVRRQLGSAKSSVEELTAKLEESERLRRAATQEADQLREQVGNPDEIIKSSTAKIASLRDENKRLKGCAAKLSDEIAALKKNLAAAEAAKNTAEANSEGVLATLTQILTQKQAVRITAEKPAKTLKAECSFTVSISSEPDWEAVLTRSAKHVGDAAAKAIIEKGKLLHSRTTSNDQSAQP